MPLPDVHRFENVGPAVEGVDQAVECGDLFCGVDRLIATLRIADRAVVTGDSRFQ